MEASHLSIFDDIGDTDFLDTPISTNHSPQVTIGFDDDPTSLNILQSVGNVTPMTSSNVATRCSQNSPSQVNGSLGYRDSSSNDNSPFADDSQTFTNSPIQVVKNEVLSGGAENKPLIQLIPNTPLVNNKPVVQNTPSHQLIKLVQNNERVNSPQLISATGNNGQALASNNGQALASNNGQVLASNNGQVLASNNGQMWQHNGNNVLIQQMQPSTQQTQYVMTDQQGQKWTQVHQPSLQPTLQVIQTSQGNKILVPAGQQLVNSNGQLTMMPQSAPSQQVVLQPLQQQQQQQHLHHQPTITPQQNVIIRPNMTFKSSPQAQRSNGQIVQIKINNQVLNITYDQLKQLQGIPNKPLEPQTVNKKPNNVKLLPQTNISLAEEKKLLLALTFRNNVQQSRLEQLMKSTNEQSIAERLESNPKVQQILTNNKFLPGWYKLPSDVYQKVLLQLDDMPKDQKDLFYLNQPKILKRFELQFQKHQQKAQLAQNFSPIIQSTLDSSISTPKKVKVSLVKAALTKSKTPKKSNAINISANISNALKQQLLKDQHNATHPNCKTPFKNMQDVFERLLPFHVFQTAFDNPEEILESEDLFDDICSDLIDRKESLLQKFKLLLLKDSMRDSPGPEHVMMLRKFVKDERNQLNKDKEDATLNPDSFKATPYIPKEDNSSEEYTLATPGDGLKLVFGKNCATKRCIIDEEMDLDDTEDDTDGQYESSLKRLKPSEQCIDSSPNKMSLMVAPSAAITVMNSEADLAVAGLLNCAPEEVDVEPLEEQAQVQSSSYDWSLTDKELDERFDAALAIPNANNLVQNSLDAKPEIADNVSMNPPDDLELAIQSILG